MVPIKEPKKDELLQLRIEKSFLDQLSSVAEQQHLPLSVMLRSWLAEKLRDEQNRLNVAHTQWINSRFENILKSKNLFEPGPLLVAHAYSKVDKSKISLEKVEQQIFSLAPAFYRTPMTSQINQFGVEVERRYRDGRIVVRGQAFKSGQLEAVISVLVAENKQIFGRLLDRTVVETTNSFCNFLRSQQIELPYALTFTLLDAKDYALVASQIIASSSPLPSFSENKVQLTEILITSPDQFVNEAVTGEYMIDALDELWNATGQKYSLSFDNNKRWVNKNS